MDGNLPVTVFENVSTRGGWLNVQEAEAFLTAVDIFLQKNRPDVMVTYGGDAVSIAAQRLAKRRGITIVFELHNFSYSDRTAFDAVDYVTVPAEFSRRFYRDRLGLDCHVLPNIVNWDAAKVPGTLRVPPGESGTRSVPDTLAMKYVTFINPHGVKGVYVFARIARELARRRPDIPLLVTQSRSRNDALLNSELGLAQHIAGQYPILRLSKTPSPRPRVHGARPLRAPCTHGRGRGENRKKRKFPTCRGEFSWKAENGIA